MHPQPKAPPGAGSQTGNWNALPRLLDQWPIGVILTDPNVRPLVLNRAAETIIKQRDGLTTSPDGLRAASPKATSMLRALIRQAASLNPSQQNASAGTTLPRPSGRQPFSVLVASSGPDGATIPMGVTVVSVFISDPARFTDPAPPLLQTLYGLSAAEAEFAAALIGGSGLLAASKRMHIGVNTAKTHLSHIFAKTGTRKQGELIHLILTGPAGMVASETSPFRL